MESDFDPRTPADDVIGDDPAAADASPSLAWVWYAELVSSLPDSRWAYGH